ncbi:hypothetical protein G7059_03080 [Erysipelothrix sp. HDW6A]|uniref:hypothetical protein n=1 Tax=Erysipelothrix sp. HDW6A TaxID=2714928 RepID=UPI0014096884|nr:hypothetical protein [Erysipelothrix sp. HDW6A]QIK56903.1 hypothetical protein G7059_03080 [Erysipelothrix sp. HDW6A]
MFKDSKKKTGYALILVCMSLLVTATFAVRDMAQHKTNRIQTTFSRDNVVLIDDFNPMNAKHWKLNEVIDNYVFVRNGQDEDDKDRYIYEDAYVRLQIKEYLEFVNYEYVYSDVRLMVDTQGNFIKYDTYDSLTSWMQENNVPQDARIIELQGYYDDIPYFYISTQYLDANGEYGKFLIMDRLTDPGVSVVINQENQSLDAKERHHDISNNEDLYTVHTWSDKEYFSYADLSNPIPQYIRLHLGEDVISYDEWIASGAEAVQKWILDTNSEEGWAYWGEKLVHNNRISVESMTAPLLESVELTKLLEGQAEYYNHIHMDAVSFDQMYLWEDAPEEIFAALGTRNNASLDLLRDEIQVMLDDIEIDNYQAYYDLIPIYEDALEIVSHRDSTESQLLVVRDKLQREYDQYISNEQAYFEKCKTNLFSAIEVKDFSVILTDTKQKYDVVYSNSIPIIENQESSENSVKEATKALNISFYGLKLAKNGPSIDPDGKIRNFAGQDWVVLHEDGQGHALIALDRQLTDTEIISMGLSSDAVHNEISANKFHSSSQSYFPGGYLNSKLKAIDEGFYNQYISDNVDNLAVLPVKIEQEERLDTLEDSTNRKDKPTSINEGEGMKTSFSLSISDINYYKIMLNRDSFGKLYIYPTFNFCFSLRSPGIQANTRLGIYSYFNKDTLKFQKNIILEQSISATYYPIIPCMWINVSE